MRFKEALYAAVVVAVAAGQVLSTSPVPTAASTATPTATPLATPMPSATPNLSGSGVGGSPVANRPIPTQTVDPIAKHPIGGDTPMPLRIHPLLPVDVHVTNGGALAAYPFTILIHDALGTAPSIEANSDGRGENTHLPSSATATLAEAVRSLEAQPELRPGAQQLFAESPSCSTPSVTRVAFDNGPYSGNLDCYADPRMKALATAVAGIEAALGLPQPRRKS